MWVVLEQDENTVTLLAPEEFYAFDGAGRVCHEFVRYIAQPNGTVLAQEIVKRVFDPADGGKELVIHEAVGGETTSELRTSSKSLDVGTVEGQWTPWAFGLSLDPTASTAETVSAGLETYQVLWLVGEAQSGRLVLQGENDGETARLVLDEIGTTMTKELTDWQTGLRFHQGSTLAASEMQWFPADAAEGDTVVRIDEWFGLEADGLRSRPKNARKVEAIGPAGVPRAAVRACVVQTTNGTRGDMRGYYANLFDMVLAIDDAVYALPTADDTTMTVSGTGVDDSDAASTSTLSGEESQVLSSLANDLVLGLVQATGGCGTPVVLTVTRSTSYGDVSASGSPTESAWNNNVKTFTYPSAPGNVDVTATSTGYYTFKEWTGDVESTSNPVTISLTTNKAITAVFNDPVTLTISIAKGDVGNSTSPAVGSHERVLNSTVQVTAAASEQYYQFIEWTGDVNPQDAYDNPVDILMSSDKDIAANFRFVMPLNNPPLDAESGLMTYWHSIEPSGFDSWGYRQERFVHLCTGTWNWPFEEVEERFVNITCDDVTLEPDEITAIKNARTAHWKTVWRTGSQIGLSRHPDVQGLWLADYDPPYAVGDVFTLTTPASILAYFENPGRQEAVVYMDQDFLSMYRQPGPPPKVLWTCHCALRFIEIMPQEGEDPGDTVLGYVPYETCHMLTDKDGKHVPEGEPSQWYDVWGWPPPQGKPVYMPNIIGNTLVQAVTRIRNAGLQYNPPTSVSHPTIAVGLVCAQDPAAESEPPYGMFVDFSLSTGPE